MGKAKTRAREIRYQDLDEMIADADQLLSGGYQQHGNWTLAQVAGHVADWARFPMDGFPTPPAPLRLVFWTLRKLGVADRMAKQIKENGFKPGIATAPQTVPPSDASDAEAVAKLRAVAAQMKNHSGPLHTSPLFGEMDPPTHLHVTLLHAAHHFGYLTPNGTEAGADADDGANEE
ncbi:MAG: DUF1569 domain-containing protein [Aureliella sp.]